MIWKSSVCTVSLVNAVEYMLDRLGEKMQSIY